MKKTLISITTLSLITIINAQGINNTLGGNTANDKFIVENKAGENLLTVTGDNRVGLGTTTPESRLHLRYGWIRTESHYGIKFHHFNGYDSIIDNTGEYLRIMNTAGGRISFSTTTVLGVALTRLIIANNGNVGIGTESPKAKLHVKDRIRIGEDSNYSGVYGEIFHTGGGNGFRINANAGGGWADMHLQTDGNTRLFIESGGNVGIGTISPTKKLYINGSAGGTQAWNASDVRYKKNISNVNNALNRILQLRGVEYEWINQSDDESTGFDDKVHYGVIAQEVEEVFPHLIDNIGETEQMKHVEYNGFIAILIEAIKEQQKQIDELKNRL